MKTIKVTRDPHYETFMTMLKTSMKGLRNQNTVLFFRWKGPHVWDPALYTNQGCYPPGLKTRTTWKQNMMKKEQKLLN